MKDRLPTYPGRVVLAPVAGAANTYDLTLADVPIEQGTPLNKSTLLQDSTAAMVGLQNNAVPDDVFKEIINNADGLTTRVDTNEDKLNNLITYGQTDLVAGTSPLATGNVYFVYE